MSANPSTGARSSSELDARAQAERAGRPFLDYRDGRGRHQVFTFNPGSTEFSVGRARSSDLRLDWDEQVSRLHARFERTGDDWVLVDDGLSRNGTFVNEQRLRGRRPLRDRDALRFGSTTVTFRSPTQAEPAGADAGISPVAAGLSTTQRKVLAALCRPYRGRRGFASPASDERIAEELFLSVGAVRTHLRVLYAKLGIEGPRAEEMRVRLVERAFSTGLISEGDL